MRSFASNGQQQYFSKLEPLETEWRSSTERQSTYLQLQPNEYTFHLKARDVYGNEWTLPPLPIHIREAYWQTTWFKVLVGVGLFLSMLSYFLLWQRRQRQQLAKEKERLAVEEAVKRKMADLEFSALRAQMNPHFIFNALGAIQYYIKTKEVRSANDYLTQFAHLMRRYLDSSREKLISLADEVELLTLYTTLEQMRFESQFKVKIEVDEELLPEETLLPSMIIQPFVENAINHGLRERKDGKALLHIRFYLKGDLLCCDIKDNGIGRKQAAANKRKGHRSRGMRIIEEKIETLRNAQLAIVEMEMKEWEVENVDFPGTVVELRMKILENIES